jgi:hypothetical protein
MAMSILQLFMDLDTLILRNFGDWEKALSTDEGKELLRQILASENRAQLHAWYDKPTTRPLNSLALALKKRFESELGETL